MREHVKLEVAFEILGMRIAMAMEKNDTEEVKKLNQERELLYNNDQEILNKIYNVYAKEIKARIGGDSNESI
mgnify:CR=1 FL=1